jgi:hypothetical protein
MIPRELTGLLADCGVLCAELAEATYSNALKLSASEARTVGCLYWLLGRIASGDPLPVEAEALPLARWLSEGLRATLAPEPPSDLHGRLNRALRSLTVTRGPLTLSRHHPPRRPAASPTR